MKNKMIYVKKITALVVAVILAVTPSSLVMADGSTEASKGEHSYNGMPVIEDVYDLTPLNDEDKTTTVPFYYSDGYFVKSSSEYDEHLATVSMHLAAASGRKADTVKDILDKSGFEDIEANKGYTEGAKEDSIGAVLAHKTIAVDGKKRNLVVTALRGIDYDDEWANNFLLGTSGDAKGFMQSADIVREDIRVYMEKRGIDGANTVFWVTGYSRGAAVTDLLTRQLTDEYGADSVYGYSFATPKAASDEDKKGTYKNSHAVVSKKDPVGVLAPDSFGFSRYGDLVEATEIGSAEKMQEQLQKLGSSLIYKENLTFYQLDLASLFKNDKKSVLAEKEPEEVTEKDIKKIENEDINNLEFVKNGRLVKNTFRKLLETMEFDERTDIELSYEEFIQGTVDMLADRVVESRKAYSEKLIEDTATVEEMISMLVGVFFSEENVNDTIVNIINSCSGKKLDSSVMSKFMVAALFGTDMLGKKEKKALYDGLWEFVHDALEKNLDKKGYQKIKKDWPAIIYMVCKATSKMISADDMSEKGIDATTLAGTWLKSGEDIINQHYPEFYLAWLQSGDGFYQNPQTGFDVKVNAGAATTGTVVNSKGNKVAIVIGGLLMILGTAFGIIIRKRRKMGN